MKQQLFILGLLFISSIGYSQASSGYIGVSAGASIPMGTLKEDGMAKTGLALNLINAGYRFTDNLGITINWGGTAHQIDTELNDTSAFGFLGIGPLITIPGDKVSFDLKPQYAFAYGEDTFVDGSKIKYEGGSGILIGASLNFDLGGAIGLSLNADALSISKFKTADDGYDIYDLDEFDENLNLLNITLGAHYKF